MEHAAGRSAGEGAGGLLPLLGQVKLYQCGDEGVTLYYVPQDDIGRDMGGGGTM